MSVPGNLTRPADPAAKTATPASRLESDPDVLAVRPNHAFFLVCYPDHPGNWSIQTIEKGPDVADDEVGIWLLPTLQREPTQPGLNGHRTVKKGMAPRAAFDDAHKVIERDGGIILDQNFEYMATRDCRHPGTGAEGVFHMDAWSTPKPHLRGQKLKFTFDRQRYLRWVLSLMRDGYLPEPSEAILEIKKANATRRVERRSALTDLPTERREAYTDEARTDEEKVKAAKVPKKVEDAPKPARGKSGTTQKKT